MGEFASARPPPFAVRLRFHDDLPFFLRPRAATAAVTRSIAERTSLKDVIEACGVPHPEVDLVLVSGKPRDFAFVVETAAEIDVYGTSSRFTIFPEYRLQVTSTDRFIADVHLGKLAANLRLLGFDVAYCRHASDDYLLHRAIEENRALLTRDRRLLMYRVVRQAYYPRSDHALTQTIEVVRRFNLQTQLKPFIRCPHCNDLLELAKKADILDQLEPLTKVFYSDFRQCRGCGHIYWRGSHFDKLQARMDEIRAHLARPQS